MMFVTRNVHEKTHGFESIDGTGSSVARLVVDASSKRLSRTFPRAKQVVHAKQKERSPFNCLNEQRIRYIFNEEQSMDKRIESGVHGRVPLSQQHAIIGTAKFKHRPCVQQNAEHGHEHSCAVVVYSSSFAVRRIATTLEPAGELVYSSCK